MTPWTPLWIALACAPPPDDHGHGHGHGDGAHDEAEVETESIAITRWGAAHELFVELDAPVAGQRFSYHAHVTRLADNHAADSGQLTIRFEQDGFAVESHTDAAVARAGIFASEAAAPSAPGVYEIVFVYIDGQERAEWRGGPVQVGADHAVPHEGQPEGEVTFLKEAQWQVPFAVAPAALHPVAPQLQASGVVKPAPGDTAVVAAPVEGLVAWADALPVVGRRVRSGERLAMLVPAGAAEHWATLQADLATARIDRDLAQRDLDRLTGLEQGVSERRLDEVRAAVARADAQVQAANRRITALTSGAAGAVAIRAPSDGVIVAVGADHGAAVGAGAPLVSVRSGRGVLIEAQVQRRHAGGLTPLASLTVSRGDWHAPKDLLALGATLLTEELVFDPRTLSAPVSVLVPEGAGLNPGDLVSVSLGVGQAEPAVAVPRSAVVEINGQSVVFVQETGESFSRRRVVLGDADATHVQVLDGVDAGEMVVVLGGFDVHVASLTGALESHKH